MKRFLVVLALLVSLSACSNKKSFVVVEESEFGDWQWEVDEISQMLNTMDLSATDADDVAAVFDEIEEIRDRMERLNRHMHSNFLNSEDIGSRGLPTRYAN